MRLGAAFSVPSLAALLLLAPLLLAVLRAPPPVPPRGIGGGALANCRAEWTKTTQLTPIDRPQKLRLAVIQYRRSGRFF